MIAGGVGKGNIIESGKLGYRERREREAAEGLSLIGGSVTVG